MAEKRAVFSAALCYNYFSCLGAGLSCKFLQVGLRLRALRRSWWLFFIMIGKSAFWTSKSRLGQAPMMAASSAAEGWEQDKSL
ncbi:hypothetical protein STRDD11_02451 [Streptococcus sp. DD11]|nr:hypothetical protein STRDD11_02451 [Streptococcus sp. DD11]